MKTMSPWFRTASLLRGIRQALSRGAAEQASTQTPRVKQAEPIRERVVAGEDTANRAGR